MRLPVKLIALVVLGFALLSAQAAHTKASLLLSVDVARPGDTVMAGAHLQMDAGWHTYWKNSGASGIPTKIEWQLPAGVTAGDIQWPLPIKTPDGEFTTYIYEGDVVLLVPLKLAADLKPGMLELKATVSWLECSHEQCVPGKAVLQTTLTVGTETKPSADAALLKSWESRLPDATDDSGLSPTAHWEKSATDNLRPLIIEWNAPRTLTGADFFPYASDNFEVQPATEILPANPGKIRLRKFVKKFEGDWPQKIGGVLIHEGKDQEAPFRKGYEANITIGAIGETAPTALVALPKSLWLMLVKAFIGGLILNIMPCVLPVIALKILGFVGQAKNQKHHIRLLGLVYGAGVLASFLIIALLIIAVKAAGHRIGWGFQFGNPYFLILITILVTMIALNLFGIFEITLSGKAMHVAHTHSSKHGATGAFFNGLLATVLATSCSAPILGTAIGFAFVQPPAILTLVLLTVGLGLATPYVVLCWEPKLLKFLPKPGAWMEKFKMAMGFPMLAASLWCYNLVATFYAERTMWLGIFLVFVALAAWIFGEFVQRGRKSRGRAWAAILIVLGVGYTFALEKEMHWREPIDATTAASADVDVNGLGWQPWSAEAVAKARTAGKPVLVDFTAKWCLTCNAIVKPTLESDAVQAKLKAVDAVMLLADYTRQNERPDIFDELNRYERAGVPLVLVFPRDPAKPAIVLPETFTQGTVLAALDEAAK